MGEAYKGLTIRIGADSTEFTKALRTANSAIKQTQSELRTIKQGLKFDESSVALIKAQLDQTGQKAQETRLKLNQMKEALGKLGSNPAVAELVESTKNLALEARIAKERYNEIDAELERMNKHFSSLKVNGEQVFNKEDWEPGLQALKDAGYEIDDLEKKYRELKKLHEKALDKKAIIEDAAAYKSLQIEVDKTEAELKDLTSTMSTLQSSTKFGSFISKELKEARNEMKLTDEVVEELKKELQGLDEAINLDPSSFELAKKKAQNLGDQIKLAENKVGSLQKQIKAIKDSGIDNAGKSTRELAENAQRAEQEFKQASESVQDVTARLYEAKRAASELEAKSGGLGGEYKKQLGEIEELEGELKELIELEERAGRALETARAEQELQDLENQVKETNAAIKGMNNQLNDATAAHSSHFSAIKSVGMTMFSTIGPAFSMVGSYAIQAADDIDSAFRNMKKTVDGTAEDFEHLREAAVEFSKVNAVSADTILNIEAMGGQLGIAVDELESFAYTVSNLDIATNMEADTIAEKLGQLASIMDISEEKFSNFGDALVRLGNNMPAQESAIMEITSRIGSMGTIMGMSTPQVLAWATAIASTGQNSEAAGTAISNTMSNIETAVAKGGKSLQGFADIAGMSAEEFKTQWEKDASGTMQAFVEGLKRLDTEGKSVDGALQGLGITAVRQKQALLGLTQTTDVLNESLTMSENAWNGISDQWGAAGDAAREAAQKSEGFSGTLQILKNNAAALGDSVGESLVPSMQLATEGLKVLLAVFEATPEPIRNVMVPLVGLAGILSGPVLTTVSSVGTLKNSFNSASEAAKQLKDAADELKLAKNGLATAAGNAADVIDDVSGSATVASTSVDKTSKSMDKGAKSAKVLTTAANGAKAALKGLAGIGGLVLASFAVDQIAKYIEHTNNLKDATFDLADAQRVAMDSVRGVNGELAGSSGTWLDYNETVRQSIATTAEMANGWKATFTEAYTNSALLDNYTSQIKDLTSQEELSEVEQAKLTAAVAEYNKITGDSVSVIDAQTGKLSTSTDEILKNAEAWKKNAEMQARQSIAAEAQENLIRQEGELEQIQQRRLDVQTQLANATKEGLSTEQVVALQSEYQLLNSQEEELIGTMNAQNGVIEEQMNAIAGADQTIKQLLGTSDEWLGAMQDNGVVLEDFVGFLEELGFTQEQLAYMSGVQVCRITNAYATIKNSGVNVDEFMAKLNELGISQTDLAEMTPNEVQKIVEAYRNGSGDLETIVTGIKSSIVKRMGETGSQGASSMASGIKSGTGNVEKAAGNMADKAESAAKVDTHSLGKNFASGFAKGIADNISLGINAASSFVNSALSAAKRAQNSHSPSRETMKLGNYFSQGFAIGIQSEAEKAARASKALVEGSLAAANGYSLNASVVNQANMTSSAANQAALAAQATTISNQRTVYQNTTNSFGDITINAHELEDVDTIEQFVSLIESAKLATGGR